MKTDRRSRRQTASAQSMTLTVADCISKGGTLVLTVGSNCRLVKRGKEVREARDVRDVSLERLLR